MSFLSSVARLVDEENHCVLCGNPTGSGMPVCVRCIENKLLTMARSCTFDRLCEHRCSRCGRQLISTKGTCIQCREPQSFVALDRAFPLFPYTPAFQELLTLWKIRGYRSLSLLFAQMLHHALENCLSRSFVLIPVPPRPGKIRSKGWDQIQELVSLVRPSSRYRVVHCLKRLSHLEQKHLSRTERGGNLEGQILCTYIPSSDCCAVLVDDVMTTGTTLEYCARSLKTAGYSEVYALSLFYD